MAKIGQVVQERWPEARTAIVHRVGLVPVGEVSVVIATSAPHRDTAYAASRFAIDTLKGGPDLEERSLRGRIGLEGQPGGEGCPLIRSIDFVASVSMNINARPQSP